MSNEATLIGDITSNPTGWTTQFDHPAGTATTLRTRVLTGPARYLAQAIASLETSLDIESLDPSVASGSAIASIRCTYRTINEGTIPEGERRMPLYTISPIAAAIDLRAHPALAGIQGEMPKIERFVSSGDIAGLAAAYAANALALQFARLWIAGVTSYERCGFILSVTRYYARLPNLAADYIAINKVFAWANIRTNGRAVPNTVTEPKWVDAAGASRGFEWRCTGISPVVQRGAAENTVQWQFHGLEAWAAWLYSGGTWVPGNIP
jgi:hypothetical protein